MYAMPGGEGLTRQVAAISCFVEVADALNRELVMVGPGITWVQHVKWVAFSLLATHRMPLTSRKEGGIKMRVNDVAGRWGRQLLLATSEVSIELVRRGLANVLKDIVSDFCQALPDY